MSSEAAAYFSRSLHDGKELDPAEPTPALRTCSTSGTSAHIATVGNSLIEQPDEDLLFQIGTGSKAALSTLFQRHARRVLNVARRILRDESEAEDLLQELFLFVFQNAPLFDRKKSSASSWIIQMTYHRAIDRRRYLSARHHYGSHNGDLEQQRATSGHISIDEIAGRTLLERLREELSPEQLQTLELHLFEGYSLHEIAKNTGQTYGNVRHHYYRGLERLRSYVFREKHP